jgi:CO/xanthine dehydrogenase FAD-binding subunit
VTVLARSLDEALGALAAQPGLLPIAGCTDVMVAGGVYETTLKGRTTVTSGTEDVLDVTRVPELRGIRLDRDGLDIGAGVAFTELRRSAAVVRLCPMLADAAAVVGGWQIQNRATIGGNIANASPAGDSLPVLLALGATLVVASAAGRREIPYDEFHVGYRRTALRAGELIVRIRIPAPAPGVVQRFRKVGTRQAQAISKVVVALAARLDGGRIVSARIAAGSVAATPVRLVRTEAALTDQPLGPETASLAGRTAADEVSPIDDVRSTAAYRAFALERVVRRMVLSL